MELDLMHGVSEADPDSGLVMSPDDFLERFKHHHRLTVVVHLYTINSQIQQSRLG